MDINQILELGKTNKDKDNYSLIRQIVKSLENDILFDVNNIKLNVVSINQTRVRLFENWLGITFTSEIFIDDIFKYIEHKYKIASNKEKTIDLDIQNTIYLENHIRFNDIKFDIEQIINECCEGEEMDVTFNQNSISFMINNHLVLMMMSPHNRILLKTDIDMSEVSLISKPQIYFGNIVSKIEELSSLFSKALICLHNMKGQAIYCDDDFEFDKTDLIQHIYSGVETKKLINLPDGRILTVERISSITYEVEIINGEFTDVSIKFKRTAMSDTEKVEYINKIVKST